MEMRKPNNGFTMLQTLFVLMIFCILAIQVRPYRPSLRLFMKQMLDQSILMQERAMREKREVSVIWLDHSVSFDGHSLRYPSSVSCESATYHYNAKGNISNALTITCYQGKTSSRLIFQLGSGRGRLE